MAGSLWSLSLKLLPGEDLVSLDVEAGSKIILMELKKLTDWEIFKFADKKEITRNCDGITVRERVHQYLIRQYYGQTTAACNPAVDESESEFIYDVQVESSFYSSTNQAPNNFHSSCTDLRRNNKDGFQVQRDVKKLLYKTEQKERRCKNLKFVNGPSESNREVNSQPALIDLVTKEDSSENAPREESLATMDGSNEVLNQVSLDRRNYVVSPRSQSSQFPAQEKVPIMNSNELYGSKQREMMQRAWSPEILAPVVQGRPKVKKWKTGQTPRKCTEFNSSSKVKNDNWQSNNFSIQKHIYNEVFKKCVSTNKITPAVQIVPNLRKRNKGCFQCGAKDHWSKECSSKRSSGCDRVNTNMRKFPGNRTRNYSVYPDRVAPLDNVPTPLALVKVSRSSNTNLNCSSTRCLSNVNSSFKQTSGSFSSLSRSSSQLSSSSCSSYRFSFCCNIPSLMSLSEFGVVNAPVIGQSIKLHPKYTYRPNFLYVSSTLAPRPSFYSGYKRQGCWNCSQDGHSWTRCSSPRKVFCRGCERPGVKISRCPNCKDEWKSSWEIHPK